MTRSSHALLAVALLGGCAGGGTALPTARPVGAAPPPRAAAPGPYAFVQPDGTVGAGAPTDDVQVAFTPSADGGDGTMTVVVGGQNVTLDGGVQQTLADGLVSQTSVQSGGWTVHELMLDFANGHEARTRLLLLGGPDGLSALPIKKDPSAVPTAPTTGGATFDTALAGLYSTQPTGAPVDEMLGRGRVSVSFANHTVAGDFADIDFVDAAGQTRETTSAGQDFGLHLSGAVEGTALQGTVTTTGGQVALSGSTTGELLGDPGGRPNGIGGAFALTGAGGVAVGAYEGECTCFSEGH